MITGEIIQAACHPNPRNKLRKLANRKLRENGFLVHRVADSDKVIVSVQIAPGRWAPIAAKYQQRVNAYELEGEETMVPVYVTLPPGQSE